MNTFTFFKGAWGSFNFTLRPVTLYWVLFGFLCIPQVGISQEVVPSHSEPYFLDREICRYYPVEGSDLISVMRSPKVIERMNSRNPCSTINVNYTGFTAQAQTAFQFAVDIWASSIDSAIPITISANFTALPSGVLGSAGPNGFYTLNGVGVPNRFYAKPLAEQILGQEIGGANSIDINANFSSSASFYFGLDANPPSGQVDFVSVVLHELGHGLGFIGFGFSDGTTGEIRDTDTGFPSIFDQYIVDGLGASILNYPDPSAALHGQLTSDALACNGLEAVAENGGARPRIYSPNPFVAGRSYSHWDEDSFAGEGINSLMTPFISPGQAVHNPGPITLGFFEDMGWSLCATLSTEQFDFNTISVTPNPFKADIRITLPGSLGNSKFNLRITDINGRTVYQKEFWGVNNQLIISNLEALNNALYFLTLHDINTGEKLTRKIIKQ